MSRGPGVVQRRITAAFKAEPARHFTVEELAFIAYPGAMIERSQLEAVRRALRTVGPKIGLHTSRAGRAGERGWRHVVGIS